MLNDGATWNEVREGLATKFNLIFPDSSAGDEAFNQFMYEVEHGHSGLFNRENLRLSFDGLRDLLDFFWFQYAYYTLVTLDTVNVYTPATVEDIANEKQAAEQLFKRVRYDIGKIDNATYDISCTEYKITTANLRNAALAQDGYTNPLPYIPDSGVVKMKTAQVTRLVRVYDGINTNSTGKWLMKASDIAGLTPQQIYEKFALPAIPTHWCYVDVPAGAEFYVGWVNQSSVPDTIQFELITWMNESWIVGEYLLP